MGHLNICLSHGGADRHQTRLERSWPSSNWWEQKELTLNQDTEQFRKQWFSFLSFRFSILLYITRVFSKEKKRISPVQLRSVCMFMCLCDFVCRWVHTCGHARIWKPGVHTLSLPQLVSILFLDMSCSLNCKLVDLVSQPVTTFQWLLCLWHKCQCRGVYISFHSRNRWTHKDSSDQWLSGPARNSFSTTLSSFKPKGKLWLHNILNAWNINCSY